MSSPTTPPPHDVSDPGVTLAESSGGAGGGAVPPTSGEEYFNSSRLKVIGLLAAGVVLVGALGGIAGVAFDPEPTETGEVVQPGGTEGPGSSGNSVGRAIARTFGATGVAAGDTESPSPVGTASPTDVGTPTETPTDSPTPTEPTDTASPSPTESPSPSPSPDDGSVVTLANGVEIYLPSGWQVDRQDDIQVNFSNGQGSWAYAYSQGGWDPSTDAGALITSNLDGLLPPEYYTQLRTSEITQIQPFGSVVSVAVLEYEALWVDNQGSVSLHGQIYAGIRQDGTALVVLVEHAPAEDWANGFEQVKDIVNVTFNRFGGF